MHARFLVYTGQGPDATAVSGEFFRWRLVSANNRALGQGASVFDDLRTCRETIAAVLALNGDEDVRLVCDVGSGFWTWQLTSRGAVLAISARPYQRQRDCRESAAAFRVAAPGGTVRRDLLVVPRGLGATAMPLRRGLSLVRGT